MVNGPDQSAPLCTAADNHPVGWLWAFGIVVAIGLGAWWLLTPALYTPTIHYHLRESRNNLHNLAIALHNYHDSYDTFPAGGTTSHDGRPYHSWQTVILPYIDKQPWHSDVNFDHPWDDPVNQAFFERTIPIYMNPVVVEAETVGGYGISHYAASIRLLATDSYIPIQAITDGTSNTLMVGEVAAGFKAWGDPTNLRDPAEGIGREENQFGRPDDLPVLFVFGDGAVRSVSPDVDPAVLRALSTPDGGEDIDAHAF